MAEQYSRVCRTTAMCIATAVLTACPSIPQPPIEPVPPVDPQARPRPSTGAGCAIAVSPIYGRTPSSDIVVELPNSRPTPGDLRPPRDADVQAISVVLEAISDPERAPIVLAALARNEPFSIPRFAVVLQDVRSTLIGLQARESLDMLPTIPGMSAELRTWMEGQLQTMILCPPTRFEHRGGLDAYETTLGLVRKYRRNLEPILFGAGDFGRPPRGPRPPELNQSDGVPRQ